MHQETKRKSLHLVAATIPVILIYVPWQFAVWPLIAFALLNVAVDMFKNRFEFLGRIYGYFFAGILRDHEINGRFTGATCFFSSLAIAYGGFVGLLGMPVQFVAVIYTGFMLGDAAAALVGKNFGKRVLYSGKTLEGFGAMVVVSFAATFWIIPGKMHLVFFASLMLAAVELFLKRLDDNFFAPLVVTLVFYAVL